MVRKLLTLLLGIILMFAAVPAGYCLEEGRSLDKVYVRCDANLSRTLAKRNMHYVIEYDHDLCGRTITVGKNSVLDFEGGSFSNGDIEGNATSLLYSGPFHGTGLTVRGCRVRGKDVIKDVEVFTEVRHTTDEIQALFDMSDGTLISFSKGDYRDVTPVIINNDIDADFNNSTIYAKVTNKRSSTVFSRGIANSGDRLNHVYIRNIVINGGIDVQELKQKLPENRPSPCIELFYVNDVVLDNVDITQFNSGTEDLKYMTLNYRDTYENYLVALMYGITAKVTNCDLSHCVNEGFKFSPVIDPDNFIEFSNNTSRNRYWTFLEVDDARCIVRDNVVEGASSSAFNLFCYDSEICNNTFRNSIRSCAVDLSEPAAGGGQYRSYNVSIHDNKCYNYPQLLDMWAGKVDVYNNFIEGIIISKTNSPGHIVRMLNKYTEDNGRSFKAPFNNPGGQDAYTKDIQIHDNVFDGEFKAGIVMGNRLSEKTEGENVVVRGNRFLDTKDRNPNYYPALFFCVKDICFEDNTVAVLKSGTFNSNADNVYFYCDKCTGVLNAVNNEVTKKVEKGLRYVFSIAGSQFDKATIKDNSGHGFKLLYKPSAQSMSKESSITTNCEPFPGTKFGKEVRLAE